LVTNTPALTGEVRQYEEEMKPVEESIDPIEPTPHFAAQAEPEAGAWEEIEPGRFMPRRVRGSYRGRALG
jgi:hypothetical protein